MESAWVLRLKPTHVGELLVSYRPNFFLPVHALLSFTKALVDLNYGKSIDLVPKY